MVAHYVQVLLEDGEGKNAPQAGLMEMRQPKMVVLDLPELGEDAFTR